MAAVQLANISKSFGADAVLSGIDLEVEDGEFVVFVGPSGCGKSTLLRVVAGLEQLSVGEVRIDGRVVNDQSPFERGIAMVFQSYALYPQMSVYDHMAFALRLGRAPQAEVDAAVRAAAETLAITHLLDRKPKALSGGQRQRVAIGRAIVRKPKVFLLDEPLSNLDAALRVRMRYEFSKLHEQLGATMIYVTHDQVEAMTLADKLVVLSEGRIMQVGPPLELYRRPANRFVAGFIGSPRMNFLAGEVSGLSGEVVDVRLATGAIVAVQADPGGANIGDRVTLGVRAEHFSFGAHDNAVEGVVRFVEQLGASSFAYIEAKGAEGEVVAQAPADAALVAGAHVSLGVAANEAHLFAADGIAFARS